MCIVPVEGARLGPTTVQRRQADRPLQAARHDEGHALGLVGRGVVGAVGHATAKAA